MASNCFIPASFPKTQAPSAALSMANKHDDGSSTGVSNGGGAGAVEEGAAGDRQHYDTLLYL
jgi:hypothetical protein